VFQTLNFVQGVIGLMKFRVYMDTAYIYGCESE